MPILMDSEPSWWVGCDFDPCGRRTYVTAPSHEAAAAAAVRRMAWVLRDDGIYCPLHGRAGVRV